MAVDFGAMLSRPIPSEGRDIEVITKEILDNKAQAGKAIIQIGRCLEEAKALLSHGEWLPWLQERVEFTERQAQRFMRLSREWSNPTALSDLGATKALSLLALEPAEREDFISEVHKVDGEEKTVIDMSARELEQAIRERKEALMAKERAEADRRAAEAAREKMAREAVLATSRIDALTEEAERHREAMDALRRELEELRAQPVDIVATNVPDEAMLESARKSGAEEAAKAARQEAEEKLRDKLDKAAKAKRDAEDELKNVRAELASLRARAESLERQVKVSSAKDLAAMAICFESVQETFNKMLGCLQKISLAGNAEEHNKLVDALHALLKALADRVPGKTEVGSHD